MTLAAPTCTGCWTRPAVNTHQRAWYCAACIRGASAPIHRPTERPTGMRADQATPGTITKNETVVVDTYGQSPDRTITYLTTADGTREFVEIWPSDHDVTNPGPGLINRYDPADFPPAAEFDPAGCLSCCSSVRHTHEPPAIRCG